MRTIHTELHRLHDVGSEYNRGALVPAFENPARVAVILDVLQSAHLGSFELGREFSLDHVFAVHERALVEFLRDAHALGRQSGRTGLLLPVCAPGRGLRTDRVPTSLDGLLSHYCFDNSTAIAQGTWPAAKGAFDVALSAAATVASGRDALVFGLCRPPGHHAGRRTYGGYCFLNNAAGAAHYLRAQGAARVSILDVDYHHGNGTQEIFYDRDDVQFISIHADPATDYPYFLGYSDETGCGAGAGFNHNLPLPRGSGWDVWSAALEQACALVETFGADVLVVSLGVDTFVGDPLASFRLESEDYLRLGARLASLRRPAVYLMEGGYAMEGLGTNVANVLSGHLDGTEIRG